MADLDMKKAREVYASLISMLDSINWSYEKEEEKLIIRSGVNGDDLPVEFLVVVNPKNEVVQFISQLPFNAPEDKRIDLSIAVNVANWGLCDGSFDYNVTDGRIIFRMTSSYRESVLGEELFKYLIMVAASTVDRYNDKFFMISKGMISIQQFIQQENED
ncbi:MAG: YbjN domain-containing protein [Clostridia bacterium]|nr:YbjN domain-containing protein [Clostridia bacterium]